MESVQQKSFKQEYLDKKELINSQFYGIKSANDMPNDHTYGTVKSKEPKVGLDDIMKYKFAAD